MTSTLLALSELARSGDRVAVRGTDSRWSHADWFDSARSIARRLIGANTRVAALLAGNSPQWLAIDLAAQLSDVVLVPLPADFTVQQVDAVVADSGADTIIVAAGSALDRALDEDRRAVKERFVDGSSLFRLKQAAPSELPPLTSKISYTRGATGRPKGVCLTRHGMDAVARSVVEVLARLELRRHLCALPLSTLFENVAGAYAALWSGAEIVVPSLDEVGGGDAAGFEPIRLLRCIAACDAHSVLLRPRMLQTLVVAIERGAAAPRSLRFVGVTGAPVPVTLLERAHAVGVPAYEGYGLTEGGCVVTLNVPGAARVGSVGRPLPHTRVTIDARGDVCVSGSAVCGYVGGSYVPARFASGDLGQVDADGFLHLAGRRRTTFVTSFGRTLSPERVEAELLADGTIAQVAVFGDARPWNVAVIVARSSSADALSIAAAIGRANERLPDPARIGDWCYAIEPFSPANGLATADGCNRRAAIWARYAGRVNALYDGALERIA